jgi:TolA-binding protein
MMTLIVVVMIMMKTIMMSMMTMIVVMMIMMMKMKMMIGSNAVDSKNKNLEEAKRTADIVMQQLNKQLSEISMKYSEEKTLRENCHGDLIVCQKSLRKALDEIRDFGKREEAWSQVIIKKDAEIDKLKTIVDNVSANINRGIHSSARRVAPTANSGLLSAPKRNIRSKTAAASSIAPSTISGSTLEPSPKKDNRSNSLRSPYERLSTTLTASAISHFEAAERERIEKEEKREEKSREAAGIIIIFTIITILSSLSPSSSSYHLHHHHHHLHRIHHPLQVLV